MSDDYNFKERLLDRLGGIELSMQRAAGAMERSAHALEALAFNEDTLIMRRAKIATAIAAGRAANGHFDAKTTLLITDELIEALDRRNNTSGVVDT